MVATTSHAGGTHGEAPQHAHNGLAEIQRHLSTSPRAIADAVSVPVIASGGVGNLQHLVDGVVEGHASAVLAASIFHFGDYTIREAKEFMQQAGVTVRL